MEYITTTNLRTQTSKLVKTLKSNGKVTLVHRSKVIGEIRPKVEGKVLTLDGIKQLKRLAAKLGLPKTTYAQREKNYRAHLMKKYGKGLS